MSRIPSFAPSQPANQPTTQGNDLRSVDVDQFLQLMITELQNQDPLNPLDNAQLLQQISQIREIGATNELTETLSAVLAGQNIATASGLIGKQVEAVSDEGENIRGVVDRVTVAVGDDDSRTLRVHVGESSVQITNVREILGEGAQTPLTPSS